MALPLLGAGLAVDVLPFTPANIPGLQLWLDASDSSTLFQNSNGTTPATADGDPVGYWVDKSGNGRNVIQTDGTGKPALRTSSLNGKSVLSFDGTSDYLNGGDILDMGTNNLTYYAVCKFNQSSDISVVLGKSKAQSIQGRYLILKYNTDIYSLFHDVTNTNVLANFTSTNWSIVSSIITRNNGSNTLYSGNSVLGAVSTGPMADQNVSWPFLVGCDSDSAGVPYTVGCMDGRISEILFFNRAITSAEKSQIDSYLSAKWGIA